MLHPAVDRAEGREQAAPGIVAAFEHFLTGGIGGGAQLRPQRTHGIVLVVDRGAEQQQPALLGREQEHQPHHHRERRLVEQRLGNAHQ